MHILMLYFLLVLNIVCVCVIFRVFFQPFRDSRQKTSDCWRRAESWELLQTESRSEAFQEHFCLLQVFEAMQPFQPVGLVHVSVQSCETWKNKKTWKWNYFLQNQVCFVLYHYNVRMKKMYIHKYIYNMIWCDMINRPWISSCKVSVPSSVLPCVHSQRRMKTSRPA